MSAPLLNEQKMATASASEEQEQEPAWAAPRRSTFQTYRLPLAVAAAVFVVFLTTATLLSNLLSATSIPRGNHSEDPIDEEQRKDVLSLFVFGDSYSSSGFAGDHPGPNLTQPFGFPTCPDCFDNEKMSMVIMTTAHGRLWPHYLGGELNTTLTLTYDFAVSGDVITEGFQTQIKDVYQPKYSSRYTDGEAQGISWNSNSSIFAIWIGINDLHVCCSSIFEPMQPGLNFEQCMAPRLDVYFHLMDDLYHTGARNFFFINLPPVDRSGMMLHESKDVVANYTYGVTAFNEMLTPYVDNFTASHDGVRSVLFDSWTPFTHILDHPQQYGFHNATCDMLDSPELGEKCLWWNDFHPTWKVHEVLAKEMEKSLPALGWPVSDKKGRPPWT